MGNSAPVSYPAFSPESLSFYSVSPIWAVDHDSGGEMRQNFPLVSSPSYRPASPSFRPVSPTPPGAGGVLEELIPVHTPEHLNRSDTIENQYVFWRHFHRTCNRQCDSLSRHPRPIFAVQTLYVWKIFLELRIARSAWRPLLGIICCRLIFDGGLSWWIHLISKLSFKM